MARIIGEVAAQGAGPPLRKRDPGFAGLAAIIVSQQVSTASAKAIWGRVSERLPALDAPTLSQVGDGRGLRRLRPFRREDSDAARRTPRPSRGANLYALMISRYDADAAEALSVRGSAVDRRYLLLSASAPTLSARRRISPPGIRPRSLPLQTPPQYVAILLTLADTNWALGSGSSRPQECSGIAIYGCATGRRASGRAGGVAWAHAHHGA